MPDQPIQEQITELFVLLPEYKDVNNVPSAPYMKQCDIDFTEQPFPQIYKRLFEELEFFRYERVDRYFDPRNLDCVKYPYEKLVYPQPYNAIIAQLKSKGFENWRKVIDEEHEVVEWCGMGLGKDVVVKCEERNRIDTLERKIHSVLYAHDETIDTEDGRIVLVNPRKNNEKVVVKVVQSLRDLYNWFVQNRLPQRRFDLDDKHGENGKGARTIPGEGLASALECDEATAQQLLHRAIGGGGPKDDMWYVDARNGKTHIYFENQGTSPQLSFHGYHLKYGEKNFKEIDQDKLSKIYP